MKNLTFLLIVGACLSIFALAQEAPVDISTLPGYCQPEDRVEGFCAQYTVQGCICYQNSSCSFTGVNRCSGCQNADVIYVEEGGNCDFNGGDTPEDTTAEESSEVIPVPANNTETEEESAEVIPVPIIIVPNNTETEEETAEVIPVPVIIVPNNTETEEETAEVIPVPVPVIVPNNTETEEETAEVIPVPIIIVPNNTETEEETAEVIPVPIIVVPNNTETEEETAEVIPVPIIIVPNNTETEEESSEIIPVPVPVPNDTNNTEPDVPVNPYIDSICTPEEREDQPCTREISQGCICYDNGTCAQGSVNKCADCQRNDVFAVFENARCPTPHPYICPAATAAPPVCAQYRTSGCVCYRNNTCAYKTDVNRCNNCAADPNIIGVFEQLECPFITPETDGSEEEQPEVDNGPTEEEEQPEEPTNGTYNCPAAENAAAICLDKWDRGCKCFNNGTCVNAWVNQCDSCDSDVSSLTPGQQCPGVPIGEDECLVLPLDAIVQCTNETHESCVCNEDGTCETAFTNLCFSCQNVGVQSVNMSGPCDGGNQEQEEENNEVVPSEEGSEGAETGENGGFQPNKCPANNEESGCSNLVTVGCVCFANGTCGYSTNGNRCVWCAQPGVISFNENEQCSGETPAPTPTPTPTPTPNPTPNPTPTPTPVPTPTPNHNGGQAIIIIDGHFYPTCDIIYHNWVQPQTIISGGGFVISGGISGGFSTGTIKTKSRPQNVMMPTRNIRVFGHN